VSYLRNFTDPAKAQYELNGDDNNMALFIQDAYNIIDDDVVAVANCLGGADRCGLQCIAECAGARPVLSGVGALVFRTALLWRYNKLING
jgi:hypothetical protein